MSPSLRVLAAVAVGGAVGALLRFALGTWIPDGDGIPWTTFAINLSGSAALAGLGRPPTWSVRRTPGPVRSGPGLLGGFTTMSAASEQTRSLLDSGDPLLAALLPARLRALLRDRACCWSASACPPSTRWPRRERAPGGARRAGGGAAALPRRVLARRRVAVGHPAGQRRGSFLLGLCSGWSLDGEDAGARRGRLLRRADDVLLLRRADRRARPAARRGVRRGRRSAWPSAPARSGYVLAQA